MANDPEDGGRVMTTKLPSGHATGVPPFMPRFSGGPGFRRFVRVSSDIALPGVSKGVEFTRTSPFGATANTGSEPFTVVGLMRRAWLSLPVRETRWT